MKRTFMNSHFLLTIPLSYFKEMTGAFVKLFGQVFNLTNGSMRSSMQGLSIRIDRFRSQIQISLTKK